MAEPTLEEVAKSWALWVAGGIIDEMEENDTVPVDLLEDVRVVLVKHLTDVAISNAKRSPGPTTTDMAARSGSAGDR